MEYTIEIEKLVFGGKAMGRLPEGKVVFVIGDILPGETAKVRVIKKKRDFLEARVVERLSKSPKRLSAQCSYFGTCGGCTIQNLEYQDQLGIKEIFIKESLKGISKIKDLEILPIIKSKDQWRYRHKVELSFLPEDDGSISLGFYHKGSWWKVVDIKDCFLFDQKIQEILKIVRKWMNNNNLSAFHHRKYVGLLRNLILRKTYYTDEWMVGIVTTEEKCENELFEKLINNLKEIINLKSFTWRVIKIKRKKGETFTDQLLWGDESIIEKLVDLDYKIQFPSFFQNNTPQAEAMIKFIINNIQSSYSLRTCEDKNSILDLYCGAGTFTLPLAKTFPNCNIIGVEIVPEAIQSAKENAALNNLNNIKFICKDASKIIDELLINQSYDVVVVDPPRAGLTDKVIEGIIDSDIKELFYVSCNPTTLARDLGKLSKKYKIKKIQPIDLFPQTYHVECIVFLGK